MQALVEVIVPVFLVIGFGALVAWRGLFSESAVDGLMKFAQTFALPCLLFRSMVGLDLGADYDAGLLISFYTGAFSSFFLGFGAARLFGRPATDSVAIGFCCLFSNSLLLGFPIMERAYGPDSLSGNFAIISIHSPMLYLFGILMMEIARSHGSGQPLHRLLLQVARGVFTTPLVIGVLSGLAWNISGLPLPVPMDAGLKMMAQAALPAALFGLGGVLYRYRPEGDMRMIAIVAVLSLIWHPGVAYLLGRFGFGLSVDHLRSAVVTASMAPGANAYIFANLYGVGKRVAASSVLIGTAASMLTIWAWLAILP